MDEVEYGIIVDLVESLESNDIWYVAMANAIRFGHESSDIAKAINKLYKLAGRSDPELTAEDCGPC